MPSKHVIGREVDQLGVHLAAGKGQVPHRQRVDQKGRLRLLLRDIHLVVSGGIEDHFGVVVGERILHRRRIGNVHLGAIPRHHGKPPVLQFADQLDAKLPGRPEDYRPSAHRNTTIANDSARSPCFWLSTSPKVGVLTRNRKTF